MSFLLNSSSVTAKGPKQKKLQLPAPTPTYVRQNSTPTYVWQSPITSDPTILMPPPSLPQKKASNGTRLASTDDEWSWMKEGPKPSTDSKNIYLATPVHTVQESAMFSQGFRSSPVLGLCSLEAESKVAN
jgi:hypothetical protein